MSSKVTQKYDKVQFVLCRLQALWEKILLAWHSSVMWLVKRSSPFSDLYSAFNLQQRESLLLLCLSASPSRPSPSRVPTFGFSSAPSVGSTWGKFCKPPDRRWTAWSSRREMGGDRILPSLNLAHRLIIFRVCIKGNVKRFNLPNRIHDVMKITPISEHEKKSAWMVLQRVVGESRLST